MRNRNGFTLIELLVVITIITVLAGLLIPGVLRAMKQAKTNRALSEMQHLATVITQVYSEIGYYVRLEDLAKNTNEITTTMRGKVWAWQNAPSPENTYTDGDNDDIDTPSAGFPSELGNLWTGPYTTYKNHINYRPLDPWKRPYRMFWTTNALVRPAGATGAMVIISAGGDGEYNYGIGSDPDNAAQSNFLNFNPAGDKGDDAYYIFNAGIQ
ncbi:MAG: prepilin-type N-terminal cleavage/methylation domain-containing protein [Candidatus Omnitrophota bacterium]